MRHAMIMAGGSGTRLWPMSRAAMPKQLIPFIQGRSLLQIALDRLQGLVEPTSQFICAGDAHRDVICNGLRFDAAQYIGEPMGRDTLNAVALGAAVISKRDADATMAVFTADHIIEPVEQFQRIVNAGFDLAEAQPNTLVTFGITPTIAATGYGYLALSDAIAGTEARVVSQFKEKPDAATAEQYLAAGASRYLWNSGMFVWRAATLLDCVRRYEPANYEGLMRIAAAWDTPQQAAVLAEVYPTLKKISVDFAVMEPASRDTSVQVAAIPMPLTWLDVGSWPSYAQVCETDAHGNSHGGGHVLHIDTRNTLVASSDPNHLIATIGCENLIIIHTADATLICPADRAEEIKAMHKRVGETHGKSRL